MTDEERIALFEALVAVFRAAGLGWVCEEVLDLIAHGVDEQVVISEWRGAGKPKRTEKRATRREPSSIERLELLITSIGRVIEDGIAVELAIRRFFVSEAQPSEEARTEEARTEPREPEATQSQRAPSQVAPRAILFRPEAGPDDESDTAFSLPDLDDLVTRSRAAAAFVARLDSVRDQARQ